VVRRKSAEVRSLQHRVTGSMKLEEGSKDKLFTTVRVETLIWFKELSARNVTFSGVIESTLCAISSPGRSALVFSSVFACLPFGASGRVPKRGFHGGGAV